MAARKPPRNRRTARRLLLQQEEAMLAEDRAWRIPTWWLNTVYGIFLLPVALLLTQTFFTAFSRAALEQAFWATEEFWFFSLGVVLWLICFFGSIWSVGAPVPLKAYIFGHELTHAVWVWLWGGKVKKFQVNADGGYILTDTHNFWIALAPYFYPIYSLALVVLYGLASLFYDVADAPPLFIWMTPLQLFFLGLGITWAFHLSFTCWMIPQGQSDLTYHGTFFSLVVIYLLNLALLAFFLVVAAPEITWRSFGRELKENAGNASAFIWQTVGLDR